ncbi:CMF_HP2_G0012210.mRNA.1.CDS.1 [Saccharomyces cerevisiae]|nr:CMF_HP2_G0012210.mRNA.1.CDS.1 [Saccharomyces cerevisiae]CAI6443519.1 CMF_HP2_G0012210.mRNA.1.CDS.1 [Saccharomyces cerevisiae]
MFADINAILYNVYGFELQGLPSKNNMNAGGNGSNNNTNKSMRLEPLGHRAQKFILLGTMSCTQKKF